MTYLLYILARKIDKTQLIDQGESQLQNIYDKDVYIVYIMIISFKFNNI
jgi:hypothetical protein